MPGTLAYTLTPHDRSQDGYDWIDIDSPEARVGKVRCLSAGETLTVFSIWIFPEYQGKGYGSRTIEMLSDQYPVLVADRVRNTAIHFWTKMGFAERPDGNWELRRTG
jgi:GNAT superfamily N-acetyltransferase